MRKKKHYIVEKKVSVVNVALTVACWGIGLLLITSLMIDKFSGDLPNEVYAICLIVTSGLIIAFGFISAENIFYKSKKEVLYE